MKKLVAVVVCILAMLLCVGAMAEIKETGTCGDNLTWTLDTEGVLTISGTGDLDDGSFPNDYVKKIVINDGVTSIGERIFYGRYFSSITIPDSVTSIGEYAFSNCASLTSITIPNGVTRIENNTFEWCASLESVTIPNSVTSIGEYAFYNCDLSLTSVTIPNSVTSLGFDAFACCSKLQSVTLSNSLTEIGSWAFTTCTSLESITIPSSVTDIGQNAFSRCTSLVRAEINADLQPEIFSSIFPGCSSLSEIAFPADHPSYTSADGVVFNKEQDTLVYYPQGRGKTYVIPDHVTTIGSYAFYDFPGLTGITIPDGVTEIGICAFSGCTGLTSVTIPGSVTVIDLQAFDACSSLASVTLSDGVTGIMNAAFHNCSSLKSITIPDSMLQIEPYAFSGCGLSEVTLSENIFRLGEESFDHTVVIHAPEGSYAAKWADENGYTLVTFAPKPTTKPTAEPTTKPTAEPTAKPTAEPTSKPTAEPTPGPTAKPTPGPTATSAPEDVEISAANFPDENFRKVVSQFDGDGDNILSSEELTGVTKIQCEKMSISSLKGIEHFTALTDLDCYENQLTTLDVSRNTALSVLYCYGNQLKSLDVSRNTALEWFDCGQNQLTSLDVSKNSALKYLGCYENQLKSLDVNNNTELLYLTCRQNQLTSLDVSRNTALQTLDLSNNQLTSLDVSKNTALLVLSCQSNRLKKLDVSKNTSLSALECEKNNLTELDVSKIPIINNLVKKTKPEEKDGVVTWLVYIENEAIAQALIVDQGVRIITDESKSDPVDISKAKVTAIKAQVYTGKAIKPNVTVKYNNRKLTKDTDYTVSYKNNKKIGTATVTITGKGDYTGKTTVRFDIIPGKVKISSLTAGKKQLAVKWSKGKAITGYEIQYSLKKNFKSAETVTIKKASATGTVLKKLQAKKIYYVRIRTYKTVSGKKYCSAWSAIKIKKTK